MNVKNKVSKLSLLAISMMASGLTYAGESQPEYIDIMNETAKKIEARIAEINGYAQSNDYLYSLDEVDFPHSHVPAFSNGKYLSINGIVYPVTTDNTVSVPMRHWSDESAMRNLFSFLGDDWELSWYQGGITFVNKKFGNYDYGNGCLLEYYPLADRIPSEYINKDYNLVRELETCYDNSMGERPKYEAERVNPHHFAVHAQYANFIAIEEYKNQLIAAHSPRAQYGEIANPVIGFYNEQTGETDKITAISKGRQYKAINDIRQHGSQLYVSAISAHNRVDIFDLETKEYQYSLGIKLDGSAKIAVTERYIFVTGENGIAVYQNVPAEKHEIKQVAPFAYLANNGAHSLELVGNKLLAVAGAAYTVYDLAALSEGNTLDAMVEVPTGFASIDLKGNQLVVKQSQRVAMYDVEKFIADGYTFKEASLGVYVVDGQGVSAKDLLLTDKGFVSLTDSVTTHVHTVNAVTFTPNISVAEAQLAFSALPQGAVVSDILQDNATNGAILSLSANTASMVNVRLLDGNTVEITNFTEFDLADVDLDIKANNQYSWARLANLDLLPAYTRIVLPVTMLNADKRFNTVEGTGVYNYTDMLKTMAGIAGAYGNEGTQDVFASRFYTTTHNPTLEKLKAITANWDIEYTDRTIFDSKELDWTAESAKRHMKLLTNMSYVMSSEEFKRKLMNYKATYGHDMQLGNTVFRSDKQYADFLNVTLGENSFTNFRKLEGVQNPYGIVNQRGTMFGLSDHELDRIERGDLNDFSHYMADQLKRNYLAGCIPTPCNWKEQHLAKLLLDVFTQLADAGELPYNQ
ncbi:hypothetical protein [Photobacterium nomapromontoriensis]|uniref:hypothetical protein n=1 Tax=Photobacterium nomapromontoriensis TaxID=2910237 RepID=UPI003D0AA866